MKKMFMFLVLGLLLVGGVYASTIYSNPTRQDGSEIIYESNPTPIKNECSREEWNDNFEDFREGIISKEDMKIYVRSCRW